MCVYIYLIHSQIMNLLQNFSIFSIDGALLNLCCLLMSYIVINVLKGESVSKAFSGGKA